MTLWNDDWRNERSESVSYFRGSFSFKSLERNTCVPCQTYNYIITSYLYVTYFTLANLAYLASICNMSMLGSPIFFKIFIPTVKYFSSKKKIFSNSWRFFYFSSNHLKHLTKNRKTKFLPSFLWFIKKMSRIWTKKLGSAVCYFPLVYLLDWLS